MTDFGLANRRYFMKCVEGLHEKCPGEKFKDVYEHDPVIGRMRSGKVKEYCECPCHSNPDNGDRKENTRRY